MPGFSRVWPRHWSIITSGGYEGFVEAAINSRASVNGDALYGDVGALKNKMRMLKERKLDSMRVQGRDARQQRQLDNAERRPS